MDVEQFPYERPRKFQHRYWVHIAFFLATLLSTSFVGAQYPPGPLTWVRFFTALPSGLYYSLPLLLILGAHEFGHYWYCRKHNVDASLPYFLPAPFVLTGTFGAVIRIKEPFPSKKALFDIGVAGPIAGFVVLVPFLYLGLSMSVVAKAPPGEIFYLGEPLLLKAMSWLRFGHVAQGFDVLLHPTGFAAWFGMLATAMNLLPFGQLDGGHISHAVFGPRARFVSMATLAATLLLVFRSWSWISMALIMLAMAVFLGFRHPRVADDHEPLDATRQAIAFGALLIFVLCFTPVPIDFFFSK